MPRRGNVAKREVLADPIYNSKLVNEGFLRTPEDVANYLRRKFQNKYF